MQQLGTDEVSYYCNECTLWTLVFIALASSAILDLFDINYTPPMLVYQYHIMTSHNN